MLHYHRYLRDGLPIATGVIEGACRHLIVDRPDCASPRVAVQWWCVLASPHLASGPAGSRARCSAFRGGRRARGCIRCAPPRTRSQRPARAPGAPGLGRPQRQRGARRLAGGGSPRPPDGVARSAPPDRAGLRAVGGGVRPSRGRSHGGSGQELPLPRAEGQHRPAGGLSRPRRPLASGRGEVVAVPRFPRVRKRVHPVLRGRADRLPPDERSRRGGGRASAAARGRQRARSLRQCVVRRADRIRRPRDGVAMTTHLGVKRAMLVGVFALALLLRGAALDRDAGYTGDEPMHVLNASEYAERGQLAPDHWYHPPLKHLVTYATIRIAGDNPYGWRSANVAFGAASVALSFLLADALLGSSVAALVAALLLAMDPLHLLLSRSTFEEIRAVFFVLLGQLLAVRYWRSGSRAALVLCGAAFGAAVAFKTYTVVLLVALAAALGTAAVRRRRPGELLDVVTALILVPFAVYLAAFAPWFHRGYGLGEWLVHQRWAFVEASTAAAERFDPMLLRLDHPAGWFVRPLGIAVPVPSPSTRFLLLSNDLPVWALVLPSLALALWDGVRERRWELLALPAAFAAAYVPLLQIGRASCRERV